MSRIGKLPIKLPEQSVANISGNVIEITYKDSKITYQLSHGVVADLEENVITLKAENKKQSKISMFVGMDRSNLNNIVSGLTEPFKVTLEVNGVGYKVSVAGNVVNLFLGFSHDIIYVLPEGISAAFEKPNHLIISGQDKVLVGQVASEIISFRPVEPYKGKGVRISGQPYLKKEGKKK